MGAPGKDDPAQKLSGNLRDERMGAADGLRKRSVMIAGHRTSVSLEAPFWEALREIAEQQGISVNRLIAGIDRSRSGNLSSAIRVYVLKRIQGRDAAGDRL
jgi:predicted DNA-binding ribbon-helix-helix protein